MKIEDCFRIGTLTKARGLKGEFQVFIDFENPERLKFDTLFLENGGKLVPYFVASFKIPMSGTAYLKLEEVDTVEMASKLVKKHVYVSNKLKPKMKEAAFGLKDLIEFTAIDENEGELGVITAIHEYPQQLIAAVTYKGYEVLFPLNEEIIKGIDVVKEQVLIDLPEGLLDIYMD